MKLLYVAFITFLYSTASYAEEQSIVKISPDLAQLEVEHQGESVIIKRNQDTKNVIATTFAKTSRPCPPFCVQPMQIGTGVETIGELELLEYLRKISWQEMDGLLIDSRTPDWVKLGTIPSAVNIPWTQLNLRSGALPMEIEAIFIDQFGVQKNQELFDYSKAKTLILFCNGAWCGQSPTNIRTLLKLGYPADKIKWYRGGMQSWEAFGLNTVMNK